MKENNIRRLPYNKTRRREKQIETEEFEKSLEAGRRKELLVYLSLLICLGIAVTGIFAFMAYIPEVVYSIMGVER